MLRSLDGKEEAAKRDVEHQEKALDDYKVQMGRPFEHEARLKELLVKQPELNAALDLDKHENQAVAEAPEQEQDSGARGFAGRVSGERGTVIAQ